MSAARRLPQISFLLGAAGFSIAALCRENVRDRAIRVLGLNLPGGFWRLAALLLALINLKNLPFSWHFRLFRGLIWHIFFQPIELQPEHLFMPVIQTTHTPMAETDYNFHKSNSTYFTDVDIGRTHLVTALLRKGIRDVNDDDAATFSFRNTSRAAGHKRKLEQQSHISPLGASGKAEEGKALTEEEWHEQVMRPGALLIALGGVSCHFHREIPPYRRYEVWTRLLTWDRKWMYVVSHFVEKGAFTPTSYVLQRDRRGSSKRVESLSDADRAKLKKKIFASSIAKYVVKKGRLTIPPEMVLMKSQMLPPRPAGVPVLGGWSPSPSKQTSPGTTSPSTPEPELVQEPRTPVANGSAKLVIPKGSPRLDDSWMDSLSPRETDAGGWTWERVQEERVKGLKLAEAFDSLDMLRDTFGAAGSDVLGQYSDLMFGF